MANDGSDGLGHREQRVHARPPARDESAPDTRWRATGRVFCIVAAAIGLLGLVGWMVHASILVHAFPARAPMMPNAALSLVLLGAAGALRFDPAAGRLSQFASRVAALVVLAIGLGTVAEYVFSIDLLIDQRLVNVGVGPHPGRPSPFTAAALALLGSGLLLFDTRPDARARPSEWLLFSGGLCALVGLASTLFGTPSLFRARGALVVSVAPATAVALLLIAVGALLERPRSGLMRRVTATGPGGVLLRRLVLPAVGGPLLLGYGVSRTFAVLDVQDFGLAVATLSALAVVVALAVLLLTAGLLDRKHDALERARARTRELIEEASDGIFLADLDGRYTDVNAAGCRMLGYSRDEIVGKSIADLLRDEDVARLAESKEQLLRGNTDIRPWKLRRKDGTFVSAEVSARILPDGRWQGLVRDITARERLESELERSYADLNRAQSVAGIGSWRLDVRENKLEWTDENYRIFGVPIGTPMNYQRFLARVHPGDRAYVDERWSAALRGEPYDIEHRLAIDGVVKWVREKADLQFDDRGELIGGIGITHDITARHRLEEELRLAETKATGIVEVSADAIISVDEDQRITMFNHGAEEIFGYSKREAIGQPLGMLVPERLRGIHAQHVDAFRRGAPTSRRMGSRTAAILGRRKSGEEFPADAAISKLQVGDACILTVALRDVTEEKRTEARVLAAQERYELALEGAELAAWDWNVKTGDVTFSRRWAEMRGLRPEDVAPHVDSWSKGVHPEDMPRVKHALADHFAGRTSIYRAEHRVRNASGGWRWIDDAGKVCARDETGAPVRMVGVELDITERKRLEEEQRFLAEVGSVLASTLDLDVSLERLGALVTKSLADFCVVGVIDERHEVQRARVVSGDASKAWIGRTLSNPPVSFRGAFRLWPALEGNRAVLAAHVSHQSLVACARTSEQLAALCAMNAQSAIYAPLAAYGRLVGVMVLISSTPGRHYEPTDVRLAEQLAQRAAFAIENARLYDEARRAIQARDDVLGVVAHDLRNPLHAIVTQASLLERTDVEPKEKITPRVQGILRAGGRMNRLIQDLLDVTKMEAGRFTIECAPLSAAEVVAEAVESQEALAKASGIDLRLEVSSDLPLVSADRERLHQVFENLIGNAIKFTRAGGHVTVGARRRDDGDVLFWVEDDGAGISPEELPHVFERFWQARQTARKGAGLGLPIVKGLVEAHGGHLWAESTVERGTTFYFTLPRTPGAPAWPSPELGAQH